MLFIGTLGRPMTKLGPILSPHCRMFANLFIMSDSRGRRVVVSGVGRVVGENGEAAQSEEAERVEETMEGVS